jgi:hypothetical protein
VIGLEVRALVVVLLSPPQPVVSAATLQKNATKEEALSCA